MDGNEVVVTVEIPRGSRNKYEYDPELGAIALDRRLFTSTVYPADYGFVEGTLAGDGDALDALVLVGDPTFPGCRIRVRVIGVFRMVDQEGGDDKLLCVPVRDPLWTEMSDLEDIPEAFRAEIEQFFKIYKELEGVTPRTAGFGGRAEALQVLEDAREASRKSTESPREV